MVINDTVGIQQMFVTENNFFFLGVMGVRVFKGEGVRQLVKGIRIPLISDTSITEFAVSLAFFSETIRKFLFLRAFLISFHKILIIFCVYFCSRIGVSM